MRVAIGPPLHPDGEGVERADGEGGGPVRLRAGGDHLSSTLTGVGWQAGQPGKTLGGKI